MSTATFSTRRYRLEAGWQRAHADSRRIIVLRTHARTQSIRQNGGRWGDSNLLLVYTVRCYYYWQRAVGQHRAANTRAQARAQAQAQDGHGPWDLPRGSLAQMTFLPSRSSQRANARSGRMGMALEEERIATRGIPRRESARKQQQLRGCWLLVP